jgi:hypothetical protein
MATTITMADKPPRNRDYMPSSLVLEEGVFFLKVENPRDAI